MRKTMKKVLLVCLALLACALMFTACDSSNEEQTPSNTTDGTPQVHTHTFGEWTIAKEATCTKKGEQERVCACGEKEIRNVDMIAHTFGEWTTVKEPTCTAKGEKERVCTCGEKETQNIDMVAHTEVTDEAVAPTCTATGLTEGKHCSVCNTVLVVQETIKANGHSFGEWKTVKKATCTEKGAQERTCSCNEKEQQEIPSTGHTEGEWIVDKEATVKEDGAKHQICSVCKESLKSETLPATGSLGLAYKVNDDGTTCTITGIGTCADTELYINDSIDGYKVTAIGDKAFSECTSITFIKIPETITSIGTRAFYGCTGITEITIPESVTNIGTQIFYKATSLHTVYYNSTYISSENPFLNTTSITKVVFGGEFVPYKILQSNVVVKEIIVKSTVKQIQGYAFDGCSSLANITLEEGITFIDGYAFSKCTSLKYIVFPDSLTSIGDQIFSGCEGVSITFGSGLNQIGYMAFHNSSFSDVYITDLNSWLSLNYPYSLPNDYYSGVKLHVMDKNGVEVTDIVIPEGITRIRKGAFKGCTAKTITIPNTVTSIGNYAFWGCFELINISIPDSVNSIGEYAFEACTSLTSLTIPDSVTSIGDGAFASCISLVNITIPDSITKIGANMFSKCPTYRNVNLPACISLTNIIIPDSVTIIGENAFYGCSGLTSVTLSDNITSLGLNAFGECTNLVSIIIPKSMTDINAYAFYNCTSLENITIHDSVTIISPSALLGCISLTRITFTGTKTQWEAITKEYSWDYNTGNYTVICSDGTISK